jgi:hypothetical protein
MMDQSMSIVTGPFPGPAPAVHARDRTLPATRSSWRAWPQVNDLRNTPIVEGATTLWTSTEADEAGAQHVAVVDRVRPAQHSVDHRYGIAADVRAPRGGPEIDMLVEQFTHAEILRQRGQQDQPGVTDQAVVVEVHLQAVQGVRD